VPSAPYIPGLTQSECLIVSALMMNEWVSTPMLYNVIAHRLRTRGEPPDTDNTVKVHIHRIRRKLAPMGITILNQYGRGYTIPEECKQILREKIAA
jgi:DNA-binding response OmpR family regulator